MRTDQDGTALLRVGGIASFLVAGAITTASLLFAVSGASATRETEQVLTDIASGRPYWIAAHVAFLAISVFLVPVIPALECVCRERSPVAARLGYVAWVAAIPAGLVPVAFAYALVPLADASGTPDVDPQAVMSFASSIRVALLISFAGMGVLIGGGTVLFSLAMLKGVFARWLGALGIVGGLLFTVGSVVPPLILLFVAANLIGIVWFLVVGLRLYRIPASTRTALRC